MVTAKRGQQLIEPYACEPRPHPGSLHGAESLERTVHVARGATSENQLDENLGEQGAQIIRDAACEVATVG
jgi:hypothetical protein